MCDFITPTVLAAAALASTAVGTGVSLYEGQQARSAAVSAQNQAAANQNEAFNSEMQAQREALAGQTAINTASQRRFAENQAATQAAEVQALSDRGAAIKTMNDQQAVTAAKANQAVTDATTATDAPALAASQDNQIAAQIAQNAPAVAQVEATNPLGKLNTGAVKEAMDAGLAGKADLVRQYGTNQANLTGYAAPVALVNRTATNLGTNLMPAAVADNLVRTGAPAILEPSTLAYQQAGTYGKALNDANSITQQGAMGLNQTAENNAIGVAQLKQGDTANAIQSNLINAQTKAAQVAALGTGLSAIGNAGLTYAGTQGAFATKKPAIG